MFEIIAGFITLSVLEIVLGIDNMLVIAIMSGRLPKEKQAKARITGLSIAMVTRVALLCSISWLVSLTSPLFTFDNHTFSWRDLILLAGGLFLLWKSVHEIHEMVEVNAEGDGEAQKDQMASMGFINCIAQIVALDIVFSLDSVITAIGLSGNLPVMIAAIIAGALSMMVFTGPMAAFLHRNPSVKVLALAFLTMVGTTLALESFHVEVPKGYLYCAMGFSFAVELLHLRRRKNARAKKAADVES